ncbi:hypothetical protein DMUE_4239 [Dictyocoela muelleri]|nr:hypothetical protein DMUE_4239 [Dictyocoela muelleri]
MKKNENYLFNNNNVNYNFNPSISGKKLETITEIEHEIERLLSEPERDIKMINALIKSYELMMYESGFYDIKKIVKWKKMLHEREEEEPENVKTINLIAKQIERLDYNIKNLDKSTLKLRSLSLSVKDIDQKINENDKVIYEKKIVEEKEIRNVYISLIVLLLVCLFIFFDKYGRLVYNFLPFLKFIFKCLF